MKIVVIAVCCAFMGCIVDANAADVDWKLYGAADHKQRCFYDANSVSLQSAGHLRIWTKCFDEDEMEAAASPGAGRDENIVKLTAEKIINGYMPPIAKVFNFPSNDQLVSVVQYETTANVSSLKPTVTIYWELSCSEKMIRTLQLSTRNGVHKTLARADWTYVEPETNGDRLLKMVCQ